MSGSRHFPGFRSAPMLLLGATLVLGFCVVLSRYLRVAPEEYSFAVQRLVYAAKRPVLMLHVGGGIAAMVLGLAQFLCLRWRAVGAWHRVLGVAYVTSVLVAAGAGLNLSTTSFEGAPTGFAFATLAVLWGASTLIALSKVLTGDVDGHRRWIVRSYALTLSALTIRAQLGLLIYGAGLSLADAYIISAWGGWIMNLVLVEWAWRPQAQGRAREARSASAPTVA